jgi:hypothetical protein
MNLTIRLVATVFIVCAALAIIAFGVSGALSSTEPHYSATAPTPRSAQTPDP